MDTSVDGSKKLPVEDLSKDEVIKKYRGLLNILQKAKQSKDSLIEENNNLKQKLEAQANAVTVSNSAATQELVDNLTQQKLSLVTSLEEVKHQKDVIQNKLRDCEINLDNAKSKIAELDTENQGYLRQVNRLTEENDQLLIHLDTLEKQTEELKKIGLQQQQQLLELEKSEISSDLAEKVRAFEALKVEHEEAKSNIESVMCINKELTKKSDELMNIIKTLEVNYKNAEILIADLKFTIEEKNKQNEGYVNTADDLNTELHKNKALVEKLQQDIVTMSNKLSNSQIVSSGVASDLENTNEKLKDKLKFYHSKIVKFAGDVKILKQQKIEVLENFRSYMKQVKLWEVQLIEFSGKMLEQFRLLEEEKLQLKTDNEQFNLKITDVETENSNLKKSNKELAEEFRHFDEEKLQLKADYEHFNLKLMEVETENSNLKKSNKDLAEEFRQLVEEKLQLKTDYEHFNLKLMEVETENSNLKKSNKELTENLKTAETKIKADETAKLTIDNKQFQEEINSSLKLIDELKLEVEALDTERTSLRKQYDAISDELKQFKDEQENEKGTLKDKIKELGEENESLRQDLGGKMKEHEADLDKLHGLNKILTDVQAELQLLKATEVKLAEQSANEIKKLIQENQNLVDKIVKLEQDVQTKVDTNECGSQAAGDVDDQISILKRENSELLAEMNEMNQALKERGETISKQQEYCEELLRNIKVYEAQSSKHLEAVQQKEEIITKLEHDLNLFKTQSLNQSAVNINETHNVIIKKDEEITHLRNELSMLREKLNSSTGDCPHDSNYAESETMSTSTISRTEEMNRIKDLEGSWEERYGKLRSLALKLKGKIRELTGELTKEQNEKADVQQKLANSLKTIQTLQAQCDKLQDDVEHSKKESKEYSKKLDAAALEISNNKKQLANNDEIMAKLKADLEALNKDKGSTDNWKKQVSGKVQNLKKELEANNVLKKDFESQISKLNAQLEAKEKLLKEEIEKHNTTKNSLQESHNECKKQSVLNLEMQDYERSLKDLTQKLEKKQELINKLKNQIDGQKSTVSAVKEQNRLLEERIQSEEGDLNSARNEIQAYKKSISDLEAVIIQKEDKVQDLTRTLEHCRVENEDLATQLSKIVAENQKSHNALKSEKDYLRSQNLVLEQRLREIEDGLKLKEDELIDIKKEYQGYKVRAKSVLRQSQTRDVGLEEKLSEEAASFKAQVTILTSELHELKSSLEKAKEDNSRLKLEKEQIEIKCRQLENALEERSKQFDALSVKHDKSISEHAEAIRGLKVHAETLAQCYRQQLSEQEVRHNREIIELQSKMEKSVPIPEVIPPLAPPSVPREQGEGSENVDTISPSRPIPLDRLLSSESDQDVGFIRKQVLENEAKVAHLTALLADTEQDLAKHVQMNKLLKEEIRRQQRSVEREQHAENLEYLKNVVFKFATLNSGDERSRLVPVLNTILKFSPDETNKLNMVARGDLGPRGWTNYLPTWSSSGKPQ